MARRHSPSSGDDRQTDLRDENADTLVSYAARQYLFENGWTTTVRDSQVLLRLDDDLTGVSMPLDWALMALAELRAMNLYCPVVCMEDREESQCFFLLTPPHRAESSPVFPAWIWRMLPPGGEIPLPTGVVKDNCVTWLRPPLPNGSTPVPVTVLSDVVASILDCTARVGSRSA
jgi:hypothetical protein